MCLSTSLLTFFSIFAPTRMRKCTANNLPMQSYLDHQLQVSSLEKYAQIQLKSEKWQTLLLWFRLYFLVWAWITEMKGLFMGHEPVGFTSSIFLWMSCSWSSHSCISESKLSIRSDLSLPQPRPPCSSPRSRSMAAMTQAALYPGASLNVNFLFLLFHKSVSVGLPAGGGTDGRIDWPGNSIKKKTW